MGEEKIINIPNFITFWRIPLVLVSIYYLFLESRILAMFIFGLAGFTDFLDGFLARRLNQETHFGAWFDVIADRVFVFLFVISLGVLFYSNSEGTSLLLLLFCFTREIFSVPAIITRRIKRKSFYGVKLIGKLQTVLQVVALAVLTGFPSVATPFVAISAIVGLAAAGVYMLDSLE